MVAPHKMGSGFRRKGLSPNFQSEIVTMAQPELPSAGIKDQVCLALE